MTLPREAIAICEQIKAATDDAKVAEAMEMAIEALLERNYVSVEVLEKLRRAG